MIVGVFCGMSYFAGSSKLIKQFLKFEIEPFFMNCDRSYYHAKNTLANINRMFEID